MPRTTIEKLRTIWRTELLSTDTWTISTIGQIAAGEAGGFRVENPIAPFGAYLKPRNLHPGGTPRAANEKIVADLAYELGMSVPPVVLYHRNPVTAGEESRCCLSLVMYGEIYEWGCLFGATKWVLPEPAKGLVLNIIRSSMARYSETLALDLLIGQTDRHSDRNVVFGIDPTDQADAAFMFVDHSFTLNHDKRWDAKGWTNIGAVPLPDVFRESLSKPRLVTGAEKIAALPDETVRSIVWRIPDEYMAEQQKKVVSDGLIGRKALVLDYVVGNF